MTSSNSNIVINGEVRLDDRTQQVLNQIQQNTNRTGQSFTGLSTAITKGLIQFQALYATVKGIYSLLSNSIELNIKMDNSKKAIAGLVATMWEIKDVTGQVSEGVNKYNNALVVAESLNKKLMLAAAKSASSYSSLLEAFQSGLSSGAQNGFTPEQIMELAVKADGTRKAMGLDQNQLNSEFRAILSGQINNNSTIGSSLGLKGNEAYKQALEQGKGYEFLIEKFKQMDNAAQDAAESVSGLFSTSGEFLEKFLADSTKGFLGPFTKLSSVLNGLVDENGEWAESLQPIIQLFNEISKGFGQILVNFVETGASGLKKIGDFLNSNTESSKLFNFALNQISSVFTTFFNSINSISDSIDKWIGWENILNVISSTIAGLAIVVKTIIALTQDAIEAILSLGVQIKDELILLFLSLKKGCLDAWNAIVSILPEEIELKLKVDTKEVEKDIQQTLKNLSENTKNDSLNNRFSNTISTLKESISPNMVNDTLQKRTEERLRKEKDLTDKNQQEIKNLTLTTQKDIDDKTVDYALKSADKVVSAWSERLNYLKDLVNFQLSVGTISFEQARTKILQINEERFKTNIEAISKKGKEEIEKIQQDINKWKTDNGNGQNLTKEGQLKYQEGLRQRQEALTNSEKSLQTSLKTLKEKHELEKLKITTDFTKKENQAKYQAFKTENEKERELNNDLMNRIELDKKQGLISEQSYYNQRREVVQKNMALIQEDLKRQIEIETDSNKKQALKNQLLVTEKQQQTQLRSLEVERLDGLTKQNEQMSNLNNQMQQALNNFNQQNLELDKEDGLVDLNDFYQQKVDLIKESYELQKQGASDNSELYEIELNEQLELKRIYQEKTNALSEYKQQILSIQNELNKNTTGLIDVDLSNRQFEENLPSKLKNFDKSDRDLVEKNERLKQTLEEINLIEQNINSLKEQQTKQQNILLQQYVKGEISFSNMSNLIEQQNEKVKTQIEEYQQLLNQISQTNPENLNIQLKTSELTTDDGLKNYVEECTGLAEDLRSSFSDAFTDIITGQTSVKEGFTNMFNDLTSQILSFMTNKIMENFLNSLLGSTQQNGASLGGLFGSLFGSIGGMATGGEVRQGIPLMVGETGRELFIPSQNGKIINASETKELYNSQKTVNNYYNTTIKGRKGDRFEDSQLNETLKIKELLDRSTRNQ